MSRSRAFHPLMLDPLETRAVPSQVYFSPQTGIILPPIGTSHTRPVAETVHHAGLSPHHVKVVPHAIKLIHPVKK